MFTSENIHQLKFKSLKFFHRHKELLSNAKFTIVNLKTGEQPEWDEGSPTFIHLIVRKRMSTDFNIFVESNDAASKLKFDENSNMEFTIVKAQPKLELRLIKVTSPAQPSPDQPQPGKYVPD